MKSLDVRIGCAADGDGNGVAYMRLARGGPALRVPFRISRYPALLGREISYGGLIAACSALRRRNVERVHLCIDDARIVEDLRERRELPAAMTLAYVRLRCALNLFKHSEVAELAPEDADLTARAQSDVAMHVAA